MSFPTGLRCASRAARSGFPRTRPRRLGRASTVTSRFVSASFPARSTRTVGSSLRGGSFAKGSSGSAGEHVVRRNPPAAGPARLGGIAGEVGRVVCERPGHAQLVHRLVRCAEADAALAVVAADVADELEVGNPGEALGFAQRMFGGLHGEGPGAAATVAGEIDASAGVRGDKAGDLAGADTAVVEAMR